MRPIFETKPEDVVKKLKEDKTRFNSYLLDATPELADRLGRAVIEHNGVNPSIVASMVLSGNHEVLPMVSQFANKQAEKIGLHPSLNRPEALSPQERGARLQRAMNTAAKTPELKTPVAATSRTTPPKPENNTSFFDKLNHYTKLTTLFDWVAPTVIEESMAGVADFGYTSAKTVSTGFLAGAAYIPQIVINELAAELNYLGPKSLRKQKSGSLFDQFIKGPLYEETYFGQLIGQSVAAARSDKKVEAKDIIGTGFLVSKNILAAQEEAAKKYRPLTEQDNLPITLGRYGMVPLVDLGIIEEGTLPYNLLSGAIDFWGALKTDPTMGKPLKQPFGSAGPAASAIKEVDAIKAAAGLAKGSRPTVLPTNWNMWKDTVEALDVLDPFVKETNPAQVWRNLKRVGLLTADEIAAAKTHGEVVAALDNAVNNIDPIYNVREIPAGKFSYTSDAGYKIKPNAQRYTSLFEMLPSSTYIPNDDVQEAAVRMDDLMGTLKFDIDTRNNWINRLIDVHKTGTRESFFNYLSDWNEEVLGKALAENLVPKEEVTRFTQWNKQTLEQITRFTLQDIYDEVPPAWMEAGGLGPVRNTQLMQGGAYVIDPTDLEEISGKLGSWYKFEQEAKSTPQPAKSIYTAGFAAKDFASDTYGWWHTKLFKPIVVAAVKYLTKVLPNEQARVWLNGTFEHPSHYAAAIADGRWAAKAGVDGMYVADVFGDPLNKAILAQEIDHQVIETKALIEKIKQLTADEKFAEALALSKDYADELAGYDDLLVKQERTQELLDGSIPGLQDALIGAVPQAARKRIEGTYASGSASKMGNLTIVSKNVGKEAKQWVKGIVQEVADLHRNPHIRRIANGGLFDSDTLTIDGVTSTWKVHQAEGRNLAADDAIAAWLLNGSGRKYFETYYKNFANIKEGYVWDSIEGSNEFVRVLNNEVKNIAGTNKVVLEAIVSGSHEGAPAFKTLPTRAIEGEEGFVNYVTNEFIKDPSSPNAIRYRTKALGKTGQVGSTVGAVYDWMLEFFFKQMYGKSSDKLSRSPAYRAAYWGRVEEVAHLASPETAQKLIKNIEAANLPRMQKDRVVRLLNLANGGADLELINKSASLYGVKYVKDLLFDSTKRSAFGMQHKYLFPFFEAWREESSTWYKLLVEKPTNGHKIDVLLRGLKDADEIGTGDENGDGKRDGFIYRDKTTGEDRVVLPGTGILASAFSGVPVGNFSMPMGSLSMFQNAGPGIGPFPSFTAQYFTPKGKDWKFINDLTFPFGRPEESRGPLAGGFLEGSVPKPIWFQRVTPYLSDVFKKIPDNLGPINSFGDLMAAALDAAGGDPKEDSVWRAYNSRVLQSLASERPRPTTQKDFEDLYADAEDATNKLYFIRGLGNFILPGIPVTKFLIKTEQGYVEQGILADIRRKYIADAKKLGQSTNEADLRFIDEWGKTTWATFGSIRRSKKYSGIIMSEEFEDWFSNKNNQKIIKTYPLIASYFGPQVEPEKFGRSEQNVYNRFVSRGIIEPQTNEELVAQAQTNVGYTLYDSVKDGMTVEVQKSKEGQDVLAAMKDVVSKYLPKWDASLDAAVSKAKREDQIVQLREIIKESSIKNTRIGKLVSSYMDIRDSEIAALNASGVKGWQKGNAKNLPLRTKLTTLGDEYSKLLPEFSSIWENVLSREFDLPVTEEQ